MPNSSNNPLIPNNGDDYNKASIIQPDTLWDKTVGNINDIKDTILTNVSDVTDPIRSKIESTIDVMKVNAKRQVETDRFKHSPTQPISNAELIDQIVPYENPLLKYHTYTWNATLYTLDPVNYSKWIQEPEASTAPRLIIAQSGVTGRYSINELRIDSVGPGFPGRTTNFSLNNASIDIIEQNGMHFLDDLVYLSNSLGYKKFIDVPLILEIKFTGYGEDGQPRESDIPTKSWMVYLNQVKSESSESGGTIKYKLMLTLGSSLTNDRMWKIDQNFEYSGGVDSLEEFCAALEKHLNSQAERLYGYIKPLFVNNASNAGFPSQEFFSFNVDARLKLNSVIRNIAQTQATGKGKGGSSSYSWKAGTPLSKILDDFMNSCNVDIPYQDGSYDQNSKRNFINVVPITKYVCFDKARNTSVFQYCYYILYYQTGDVLTYNELYDETFSVQAFSKTLERKRVLGSNDYKLYMKVYNYLYTSENSEILKLNLNFDQEFYIAVNKNSESLVDKQNKGGTNQSSIVFAGRAFDINDMQDLQDLHLLRAQLTQNKRSGGLTTAEQEDLINSTGNINDWILNKADGNENNKDTTYDVENISDTQYTIQDDVFVEDYRALNSYSMVVNGEKIAANRVNMESVPVDYENIKSINNSKKNENDQMGENLRREIRNNYYNRTFMANINMDVIGDPYWLGWDHRSYLKYLQNITGTDSAGSLFLEYDPQDLNSANYFTSETYFLLNIRPVVSIDDRTGVLDYNEESLFNKSVFRVNKVESLFTSGGSFKQVLSGNLIMRSIRRIEGNDG